jgi:hypothetical protein
MSQRADAGARGPEANATRGLLLLVVLVALAVLVLWRGYGNGSTTEAGGTGDATTTTADPDTTTTTAGTTTTAAPTTTLPAIAPSEIKVKVANGTETKGLAGRVSDELKAQGYTVLQATDARPKPFPETVVYFVGDAVAKAQVVAAALEVAAERVSLVPSPAPVADLGEADVLVVLGVDATTTTTTG